MNQTVMDATGEDTWSQLQGFITNLSMDATGDTFSLMDFSDDLQDLFGFEDIDTGCGTIIDDADIVSVFGSPSVQEVTPVTLKLSSPGDYIHGAKTYTAKSFNLVLGIAMAAVGYNDPLTEFCGNLGLESKILHAIVNEKRFVTSKIVTEPSGEESIEVSVRRSFLINLFHHKDNKPGKGSRRLTEMFMGSGDGNRSSANIRKIWGSLIRDMTRRRNGVGRNRFEYLDKIGYRKISAKNCLFVLRISNVANPSTIISEGSISI